MLPTTIYTIALPANGVLRLPLQGEYFKILQATGNVKVLADWGTLDSLTAGQGLEKSPFNYLEFTDKTGAPNTIKFLVGDRNFIDGLTGNVVVTSGNITVGGTVAVSNFPATSAPSVPQSGNFGAYGSSIGNSSGLVANANGARQYLLIQNRDGAGNIYLTFGVAATVATGIKIPPGGSYEPTGIVTTQAIYGIGDIASNTNVLVASA
jgi:hypothetical protein